ncbi:hypothetical protein Bhyg_16875 [Pseudolycoriella hygida]|uniref:Nucleolus and neural progenitor protein-like N-terminal domain-containing protein n=1 Tax=Pseudolycoriella hygida TaxID=35572 RepID=A0A9Q0MLQ0_9DIPT|nr:hypothetical protein Bhyg_16875 [Pseudolycoriella hygida]
MALLWNDRNLSGPPIYTKDRYPKDLNLSALRQLIESMVTTYSTNTFNDTGALTSRLIARRSSSFRSQCGFKAFRKTNVALCRLKDISIISVLENFLGTLPDYIVEGAKLSLPTYDNFEFVMLRLQGLSKLLLRIAVSSRQSFALFRDMIKRNLFVETSALYVGLLAQIWHLAKTLSIKTREYYDALYRYKKYFPMKSADGSSVKALLCENLEDFLTEEWRNEFFTDSKNQRQVGKCEDVVGFDFCDFNDDGENIATIREEKTKPTKTIELKNIIHQEFQPIETKKELVTNASDFGVAISRDSLEEIVDVDRIVRTEEISKLINEEQLLRDKRSAKRTRHLSDNEWKDFKLKVRNLLVTNQRKMCIKKFKSLWKSVVK